MSSSSTASKGTLRSSENVPWKAIIEAFVVVADQQSSGPFSWNAIKEIHGWEKVSDLLNFWLSHADDDGYLPNDQVLVVTKKIMPHITDEELLIKIADGMVNNASEDGVKSNVRTFMVSYLLLLPPEVMAAEGGQKNLLFNFADAKQNNKLSRDELREALKAIYRGIGKMGVPTMSPEQKEQLEKELNEVYSDEKIDYMTERCFEACDTNKDGSLSREEWNKWYCEEQLYACFGSGAKILPH